MFFFFSKALLFLLNPLIWIMFLLIFALWGKRTKWKKRSLQISLILLLFFSNSFLANTVFAYWETETITVADIQEPYDLGIVLGGFSFPPDNRPNEAQLYYFEGNNANRFTQAVELYQLGKVKKLLISGGWGTFEAHELSEAEAAKLFLLKFGIPASAILIETTSRNTHENALHSKKIIDQIPKKDKQHILLLTSAFHIHRAQKCFEKVGLKTTPFGVDFKASRKPFSLVGALSFSPNAIAVWQSLLKEWVGLVAYKIRGYI